MRGKSLLVHSCQSTRSLVPLLSQLAIRFDLTTFFLKPDWMPEQSCEAQVGQGCHLSPEVPGGVNIRVAMENWMINPTQG